jgi:alpha-tubulin suppressor-like RCC1 family protein
MKALRFALTGLIVTLGLGCPPPKPPPAAVLPRLNYEAITAGGAHSCVLFRAGANVSPECWGRNSQGQWGNGQTTGTPLDREGPAGLNDAARIAAGGNHTCALRKTGALDCWGANDFGQVGAGRTDPEITTPVTVIATGVAAVTAGDNHTCALLTSGQVQCWGAGSQGQLGTGSRKDASTPQNAGVANAKRVVAGGAHTCAIRSDDTVVCWGENLDGQLGVQTVQALPSATPRNVVDPVTRQNLKATALGLGFAHTCAVMPNGSVKCWGANTQGQLGNGQVNTAQNPDAIPVPGIASASDLTAGREHTCVLLTDHTVQCWGANQLGQCGTGTVSAAPVLQPTTVTGLEVNVAIPPAPPQMAQTSNQISSRRWHTCALGPFLGVKCWGYNDAGQLGDGTTTNSPRPVS